MVETTADSGGTAGAITETLRQGKSLFTCFNPNRKDAATNNVGAVQLANEDDWKMVLQYMV